MQKDAVPTIRANLGSTVNLQCSSATAFPKASQVVVQWKRVGTSKATCGHIVDQGNITKQNCKERMAILENHQLQLNDLQISDAGQYNCTVSRQIPPPTEEKTDYLILRVEASPVIRLEYLNTSGNNSGTCKQLICKLKFLNSSEVNFTWTRNGERIYKGVKSEDPVQSDDTYFSAAGYLTLCKPDWKESDVIQCTGNYYNDSIILKEDSILHNITDKNCCNLNFIIIIVTSACLLTSIVVGSSLFLCFWKRARLRANDNNSPIVFNNKVYENFSFSTARTQRAETDQSSHCIYEN
nr:PREDICTED: uncharacterized protein LOC107076672 isoform X2 [Lepisosteus oculatus]